MDVSELTQLINSVGFPIVACGALFWMLKDTLDKVVQSLDKMNDKLDKLIVDLRLLKTN